MRYGKILLDILERFHIRGTNVILLMAAVVGVTTALGAIGFTALIRYFNRLFFGMTDQVLSNALGGGELHYWAPLIPMLGGLLVGPIVTHFAKEAKGHGVPEVMNAVARGGGIIRPRVSIAKALASAICIGSGGSAGREGPIVQIGSTLGSTVAQIFGLSSDRIRILVGCGAAAGISAVFNAPIAGVLFSVEVILGDYTISTFSPVLIASVVASVLTRSILGNNPAFEVPHYELVSAWEIPMYVVMGVALGAIAVLFIRTLDVFEDFFERLKMKPIIKPALGGLLLGIVAFFFPQVLADGYETIHLTLYNEMTIQLLLPLIFLKIMATSLTLGSGSSGGIFAPSLFIGAVAGGSFGTAANLLFPGVTASPGAFALVGMAGLVAGTTHAPMTALMIIFEMTSDYRIILPLMVTVAISSLVSRGMFTHSIYTLKLFKRGIDLRAGRDLAVLRGHHVSELMESNFATVNADARMDVILSELEDSTASELLVLDRERRLLGMISLEDMKPVLPYRDTGGLIVATDLLKPETPTLTIDDTLEIALDKFKLSGATIIPVLQSKESNTVLGVLSHHSLLEYYNRSLLEQMRK